MLEQMPDTRREGEEMTRADQMRTEALTHIAKREYSHKKWLKRQENYRQIKNQDWYGYKKGVAKK